MKKGFSALLLIVFLAAPLWAGDSRGYFVMSFTPANISWNPQKGFTTTEAQIFTALYEGLVSYQPASLQPEPGCAESWDISEEGRIYTFHLRENLQFHTGEKITADTFRNSWLKLLHPDSHADYASLLDVIKNAADYRKGKTSAEEVGIRSIDDRTLQIELEKPAPHFLSIICHYSFVPVSRDLINVDDWSRLGEIPANGPFRLTKRTTDEITLVPNESYWDRKTVEIPGINITFSSDSQKTMTEFNRYRTDWISSGMDVNKLLIPESIILSNQFSTGYYYFNNRQEIWQNKDIRRALALLLPWEKIYNSHRFPGKTLVPPIPGYPLAGGIDGRNLEEAAELLEKAGYPGGKGLPPIVIRTPFQPENDAIGQLMKQSWEELLDIEVILDTVTYPDYYGALRRDDYALGIITWVGDYADPLTFLQMWESGNSLNDAHFSMSEYDEALKEASDFQGEERLKKLSEAESLLLESAQVMPLEHYPSFNLIDLRFIDGWYKNYLDIHPFKYIRFRNSFMIPGVI